MVLLKLCSKNNCNAIKKKKKIGIYMIVQGTSNITMVPDFDIYHGTKNVLQKHPKSNGSAMLTCQINMVVPWYFCLLFCKVTQKMY